MAACPSQAPARQDDAAARPGVATAGGPIVTRTVSETRRALAVLPRPLGLVPTMGALHDGHLALVRAAAADCASVAVSIFVNPTQFGPDDDLARYPRDEARDVRLAAAAGATLVFAPFATEMYRSASATVVRVEGPPAAGFEAAERPGHFDGVATIVTKLLTIVAPDRAYFGRKDAQQLAVVRRLAADLDLPVAIVPIDTLREADGLAMSSRNAYLGPAERAAAPALHRALLAGREAAGRGAPAIVAAVAARLAGEPRFALDYAAVVDPERFTPVDEGAPVPPGSLIVAAARLGGTRLLDNVPVDAAPAAARPGGVPTNQAPDPRGGPDTTSPPGARAARQED
jgi:pantoate--beta-alanine ligase